MRRPLISVLAIIASGLLGGPVLAQGQPERLPWLDQQGNSAPRSAARRDDSYRPTESGSGFGTLQGQGPQSGQPAYRQGGGQYDDDDGQPQSQAYGSPPPANGGQYGSPQNGGSQYGGSPYGAAPYGAAPYGGGSASGSQYGGYGSGQSGNGQYGGRQAGNSSYGDNPYAGGGGTAAPAPYGQGGQAYGQRYPSAGRTDDAYRPPSGAGNGAAPGPYAASQGFGQPYSPPPDSYQEDGRSPPGRPPYRDDRYGERGDGTYSSNEILSAGHGFFGSVSKGLANAIEYVFQRQGRPNGYILGEDAGGAFIAGLRYGEGVLYTKDAGSHRVYWQGPTIGYDAGAEGSKAMVLVYNLRDPNEIYDRFPGVSGSAYVVGGVSLNFQAKDHIVLAPIRSGIGLRLGANIGYLKYTRSPTWNPF